jgi:hypothetical protein
MDFDLNIEAMVEGDDQVLEDFEGMLEAEQEPEHDHAIPEVELAIEIDLNAPASMDPDSSVEDSDSDGHMSEEQDASKEVHIVLALQADL